MWKIPLFDLNYDRNEELAVIDVLKSKWLSSGKNVRTFEVEFSSYLGKNIESFAVSSCTAALHLALMSVGIKAGDEVILSALSFVAALNVTSVIGAKPVLADAQSLFDWNVSLDDIKKKVTDKTKAVVIVHFAGYPCEIEKIASFCKNRNIILIEDCAHAIGASYQGKKCGTWGDIGCFSFFSNKNLSTGEGGMVVTKQPVMAEKIRLLRSHGMTSMTIDRHRGKNTGYDVVVPGLNYRMDEIRAALGLVQLSKLDNANQKRRAIVSKYRELLKKSNCIIPWRCFIDSFDNSSSYHIFPILLESQEKRDEVRDILRVNRIQTSMHYPSYKLFSAYNDKLGKVSTPVADEISERVLTLPLYPDLSFNDIEIISNLINNL